MALGVLLHLAERHEHQHVHDAMEHEQAVLGRAAARDVEVRAIILDADVIIGGVS